MKRIPGSFDPIANLWAVFATSGSYQTAAREPRGIKLRRAFNTRAQAAPEIRDRMVTAGDICITAVAQTRPDQELVALEMFGSSLGQGLFLAHLRSARCPLFGRYEGKSGRRGHRVFVDTEVRRGGPLLEVAGHGRESLASRVPRGCCEQHFVPAHNPRPVLLGQKSICDNESHHARENQ